MYCPHTPVVWLWPRQAHFFLFLFSSFPMGWPPLPVGLGCPLPFHLLAASMEDPVTALVLDGPLSHPVHGKS